MSDFIRTSRPSPCKVCGKHGWCSATSDGAVAKCMYVAEGAFKSQEDGSGLAHYHRLIDDPDWQDRPRRDRVIRKPLAVDRSLAKLASMARSSLSDRSLECLSAELGLSRASLDRLGVGWISARELEHRETPCSARGCWSFPMRDASQQVVGIRLRTPDGFKYAVRTPEDCMGSGIFIPARLGATGKPMVLIAEGPTDTAALLDMGFDAVGRPSNTAGTEMLRDFIVAQTQAMGWSEAVILIDRDKPGTDAAKNTWRGARTLADALVSPRRSVRIIQPPVGIKDARAWLQSGANEDDLLGVIESESPVTRGRFDWMRTKKAKGAA